MEQKKLCETKQCTGCFACLNACPKDAISITTDAMGKTIPIIHQQKCIDCGKCERVCPVNQKVELHEIQHCYAAKTKQKSDEEECASGGIAATFYRYFLRQGGVVFGAAFDANLTLCQMACESEEEMLKFRGSKYVQSAVGLTYRQVKKYLQQGRKVLYIGTPCQIAGLRSYLGKEEENLLLIDIVCHGVPPMQYLKEYQKKACKGKPANRATFRGKYDYQMRFYEEDAVVYQRASNADLYFAAFSAGETMRDNCYECTYAQPNRAGDLTIGDFWELNRATLKENLTGRISVVLVNTSKGELYFQQINENLISEEREISEAVNGNTQLREPTPYSQGAQKFHQFYPKKGFMKAVRKTKTGKKVCLRQSKIGNVAIKMKRYIKK